MAIVLHREDPELLRRAIEFTAAESRYSARLVEKDYFCSVVLEYLAATLPGLTFKGGTCLTKIYRSFYRLSEDLDFSISTAADARRADRSRSIQPVKAAVEALPRRLPGLRIIEPLRGFNDSTQYNAMAGYESLLDGHVESVSIEVSVREPTLREVHPGAATTLLLNPLSGERLVEGYTVVALSYPEAMAEKLRAALSRRDVAIRDFFDIDHAVRGGFDPRDAEVLHLTRRKLDVPGTQALDVSDTRMAALRPQVEAQLRPVLREEEFAAFDLVRAVETVRAIAQALERR